MTPDDAVAVYAVTAGTGPATGERIVLTEISPTLKEATRARIRLLAEADGMERVVPKPQ